MAPAARYDTIGHGYAARRRPDPRIAAQIWSAVGEAERILNVGAGTGSYESGGRRIVAVEPSAVMIGQRPAGTGPAVQAVAEHLPFADGTFDVALALMTVHHWPDLARGLAELRRVARRQVVFTFDPAVHDTIWILREYVPAALGLADTAALDQVVDLLGARRVEVVPVPADCTDGFLLAYWRRPEQFLLPEVRAATSAFARLPQSDVEPGLARLARDLADGSWRARHADLLDRVSLDAGLRLVIAG